MIKTHKAGRILADRMNILPTFQRATTMAVAVAAMLALQGCLATKIVTVPVKVAYGAGKLAVKGTAAAVRAVVPDDEETPPQEEQKEEQEKQDPPQPQPPAS